MFSVQTLVLACVWLGWSAGASAGKPGRAPGISQRIKNSSGGITFQGNNKRELPLSLPFCNTFQASA